MDRSVDSIGTCSLDVDASADLTDWSEEFSSVGTLRSASIVTPSPEPHLPSYLSLACTVNGYSTTTNYDPIRLSKSRDASPHRPADDHLANATPKRYSIQNNLLSPPNLVPLPTEGKKMAENALTHHHHHHRHHQEFYSSSSKTSSFLKESHFTRKLFNNSNDATDACFENGHKCVSYESRNVLSAVNGQTNKCSSETIIKQEWKNNSKSSKSFIQQRVERLYGPGALAQGFFVTTRQRSRNSDSEFDQVQNNSKIKEENDKHSKSMSDKLLLDEASESSIMKQSTSSPTLPVMRHLRPEFRAQLPIISSRKFKESCSSMQKSSTVPTLNNEVKVNGHSQAEKITVVPVPEIIDSKSRIDTGEKDGHYFLEILDGEAKRLLKLADQADTELNTEGLSDEVVGKLRSAAGKARLLVSQKMQQFKGLCTNNITQVDGEAFPTTNEDLQGFWDMVMLQVDQIDNLFKEINTLKANNWNEIIEDKVDGKTPQPSINTKKRLVNRMKPVLSTASEEARKQREAQRKQMIEERRKAMRAQNKPKESIEIFVPESS